MRAIMVFFEGGGKYTLSLISFGRYWFDKYIYAIYTVIYIYICDHFSSDVGGAKVGNRYLLVSSAFVESPFFDICVTFSE